VGDKKRFLLRLEPQIHERLEKWAADELRSVNAQIEYLLREALRRGGRLGVEKPVLRSADRGDDSESRLEE
jgi:hypothetical protein